MNQLLGFYLLKLKQIITAMGYYFHLAFLKRKTSYTLLNVRKTPGTCSSLDGNEGGENGEVMISLPSGFWVKYLRE